MPSSFIHHGCPVRLLPLRLPHHADGTAQGYTHIRWLVARAAHERNQQEMRGRQRTVAMRAVRAAFPAHQHRRVHRPLPVDSLRSAQRAGNAACLATAPRYLR